MGREKIHTTTSSRPHMITGETHPSFLCFPTHLTGVGGLNPCRWEWLDVGGEVLTPGERSYGKHGRLHT